MISLITCSVNPQVLSEFKDNVAQTIGIEYELIAFDNREKNWGLCKVYNYCASQAKFDFICFVHEDVFFFTKGWGKILLEFNYKTTNCGIIGFAGANYIDRNYVQWKIDKIISRVHTCLSSKKSLPIDYNRLMRFYNSQDAFDPVITIDGMFMFVSKKVWQEIRFDEERYPDFHIYDTDFSFSVSLNYNNYVCSLIDNMHRCKSSFPISYIEGLIHFHKKRREMLPVGKNTNKLHSWLIKNHEILEFSESLRLNSYTEEQYNLYMTQFYSNYQVNSLRRIINYVYGKIMNIKIRKIRHLQNR